MPLKPKLFLPTVFDQLDLVTYEEVVKLPSFRRKTLVLLGTYGGKRTWVGLVFFKKKKYTIKSILPRQLREGMRTIFENAGV